MNPNQVFNQYQSELGMIGLKVQLGRIDFQSIHIKRDCKRFSEWFGTVWNSSDWISIRNLCHGYK